MIKISMIAAIGKRRELGKENKLLWHIPSDMKRFRQITVNHAVIMGRKTYESIGRPLPKRTNIVVTRDINFKADGCIVVHSLEEGIEVGKTHEKEELFIIGGAQIYTQGLQYADRLYMTLIDGEFDADAFFPEYSEFTKVVSEEKGEENGFRYT
ncbi:MAG: dihydrofolate reductase, partial [bacterium]|nr:dihydrofolate reductase [bacterium]